MKNLILTLTVLSSSFSYAGTRIKKGAVGKQKTIRIELSGPVAQKLFDSLSIQPVTDSAADGSGLAFTKEGNGVSCSMSTDRQDEYSYSCAIEFSAESNTPDVGGI